MLATCLPFPRITSVPSHSIAASARSTISWWSTAADTARALITDCPSEDEDRPRSPSITVRRRLVAITDLHPDEARAASPASTRLPSPRPRCSPASPRCRRRLPVKPANTGPRPACQLPTTGVSLPARGGWRASAGGAPRPAAQRLRHTGRQAVRDRSQQMGAHPPPDLVRINADNTRRLNGFARYGWPRVTLVGEQHADEAWLLAQRTARDPDFQRQFFGLLHEAAGAGGRPTPPPRLDHRPVLVAASQPPVWGPGAPGDPEPIAGLEHATAGRLVLFGSVVEIDSGSPQHDHRTVPKGCPVTDQESRQALR